MDKRVLISVFIGIIIILTICICLFFINKKSREITKPVNQAIPAKEVKIQKQPVNQNKKLDTHKLYSSDLDLPFVTLFDISKMSTKEQEKINKILSDYQGACIIKYNTKTNTFLIITPNKIRNESVFDRHNIEIMVISLNDGSINTLTLGFSGLDGETANAVEGFKTENERWNFDKSTEVSRPHKHIVQNQDGSIEYEEVWNYNEKEPVKYEMKDGEGHTISILKETFTGETAYDQEHIFYDKTGQTDIIISIHYEDANITRLTYYNINDKENSFTIISEYTDGIKTGEKIYNNDYVLLYDLKAEYIDGQISQIELLKDNNENEVIKK